MQDSAFRPAAAAVLELGREQPLAEAAVALQMRDLVVVDRPEAQRLCEADDIVVVWPCDLVELFCPSQQLAHPHPVGVIERLGLLELPQAAPNLPFVQQHPLIVPELVVKFAVLRPQRQRQMLYDFGALVVPDAEEAGLHEGAADRTGNPVLPAGARIREKALKLSEATGRAGPRGHDILVDAEVAAEFMLDGLAEALDLAVPLPALE